MIILTRSDLANLVAGHTLDGDGLSIGFEPVAYIAKTIANELSKSSAKKLRKVTA
jgi:hypothetical protein